MLQLSDPDDRIVIHCHFVDTGFLSQRPLLRGKIYVQLPPGRLGWRRMGVKKHPSRSFGKGSSRAGQS